MPRTVIPRTAAASTLGADAPDDLATKLAKYIPAEVLAFYLPIASTIDTRKDGVLRLALAVAVAGSPAYLYLRGKALSADKRPRWFFYILAAVATIGWAIGASANTASLFKLDDTTAGLVVALTIFAVPLVDGLLDAWFPRKSSSK